MNPVRKGRRHLRALGGHTHARTHARTHTHTLTHAQVCLQSHAVLSRWVSPRRRDQRRGSAVVTHSGPWLLAEPLSLPLTPLTHSRGSLGSPLCRGGGHCAHLQPEEEACGARGGGMWSQRRRHVEPKEEACGARGGCTLQRGEDTRASREGTLFYPSSHLPC